MRKITALLLALVMLLTATAFASGANLVELDLGDFTMTVPADMYVEMAEQIVPNEPFIQLYETTDPNAAVNPNMNILWINEVNNFSLIDPFEFANEIVAQSIDGLNAAGIGATNPAVLDASMDQQDGKPALFIMYSYDADYTPMGIDLQATLCTIQMFVSDAAFGGTYCVTIVTHDINAAMQLINAADSITWKV